ncbi:MAG TPA: CAP domain-containing protein, partial [Solirubrobacteraceae bacterium]|nr:CAP domain-containing protein [Solirubrobacteraceae bacterium]
ASDYFDHVAPGGADVLGRVVAAGFAIAHNVLDLGENLAAAAGSLATPAATVADWMSSPPHRANILDPTYRQTGIGVTPAVPAMLGIGQAGATYTQTFGTAA